MSLTICKYCTNGHICHVSYTSGEVRSAVETIVSEDGMTSAGKVIALTNLIKQLSRVEIVPEGGSSEH